MASILGSLPQVPVCTICLSVNDQQWAQFSPGVSEEIKKQMAIVLQQIQAERKNKQHAAFSDGYCTYHAKALYTFYQAGEAPATSVPMLIEDTPEMEKIRQYYMRGIFTYQQIQAAQQQQQQSNQDLKERFQKLAGLS
jgi:hypothetical protein